MNVTSPISMTIFTRFLRVRSWTALLTSFAEAASNRPANVSTSTFRLFSFLISMVNFPPSHHKQVVGLPAINLFSHRHTVFSLLIFIFHEIHDLLDDHKASPPLRIMLAMSSGETSSDEAFISSNIFGSIDVPVSQTSRVIPAVSKENTISTWLSGAFP